jgi:pre-mRNA-splicing factor ISY1
VKELFEAATKPREDKALETRHDLRKLVDASYYGYNLDEEEAFERLLEGKDGKAPKKWEPLPGDAGDGEPWKLPTSEEVQEELVERRRRRLLDKLG